MVRMNRRSCLQGVVAAAVLAPRTWEEAASGWGAEGLKLPEGRPARAERHFSSTSVEALIPQIQRRIADPALAVIFENCYPNTLDTTVWPGSFEGKPYTW